ncbi:MAG: pentapeptide repeat-containing protein [Cyanobacteria bacterium P01_H01_bin.150]
MLTLRNVDVSGINFNKIKLSYVNLNGVNLIGANFDDAKVEHAIFANNSEISGESKFNLTKHGAIFEDSPGDCSPNYSATPFSIPYEYNSQR